MDDDRRGCKRKLILDKGVWNSMDLEESFIDDSFEDATYEPPMSRNNLSTSSSEDSDFDLLPASRISETYV